MNGEKTRVLLFERDAEMQSALLAYFGKRPDITVIRAYHGLHAFFMETAQMGARTVMDELAPDVIVMDVQKSLTNDLLAIARLREITFSPMIAFTACPLGEQPLNGISFFDVVVRPVSGGEALSAAMRMLVYAVRRAAIAQEKPHAILTDALQRARSDTELIVIGASMGGTEAILHILSLLPLGMPPVLIVQHITTGFAEVFAGHIASKCRIPAKVAGDQELALSGHVYVAPDGAHMTVQRHAGAYALCCKPGERVTGHLPSIDALFYSVAAQAGKAALGVLLTGMGRDGAAGLLAMRRAGALTIAQDEDTSLVWGMPKAAIDMGAASMICPLASIAGELLAHTLRFSKN